MLIIRFGVCGTTWNGTGGNAANCTISKRCGRKKKQRKWDDREEGDCDGTSVRFFAFYSDVHIAWRIIVTVWRGDKVIIEFVAEVVEYDF